MSDSALERHVRSLIADLARWVGANGIAGWDPYDVWDNSLGQWAMARGSLPARALGWGLTHAELRAPVLIRRLLGVRKRAVAKGVGLLAGALTELEASSPELLEGLGAPSASGLFDWLRSERVTFGEGYGWGYPFDWQSRVAIPRGTPSVVVSTIVGDAHWRRWSSFGDAASLESCLAVVRFVLTALNRSLEEADGAFCFSYTPIDHFEVHNANLLGAEFVARVAASIRRDDWLRVAASAGRFALRDQRDDGTLSYWSSRQTTGPVEQDLYHAGFEIRSLLGLATATGEGAFRAAAERYARTWMAEYFDLNGTPCYARGQFDTLEVHSVSEALLCLAQLRRHGILSSDTWRDRVERVITQALEPLLCRTTDGAFVAWMRLAGREGSKGALVRIPLVRWGQAWMLLALVDTLKTIDADGGR